MCCGYVLLICGLFKYIYEYGIESVKVILQIILGFLISAIGTPIISKFISNADIESDEINYFFIKV